MSNIFGRICVHYFLDVFASTFFSDAFASIFYQIVIWTPQFQPVYICVQITPSLWFWCLFVLQHLKFNQDLFVKLSYVCYSNGRVFYLRESAHQKSGFLGVQRPAKRSWAQSWPISHRERLESTQRKHQSKFYLCVAMPPCTRHVDVMTFQEVG